METQDTQLVYGPFISRAQAKAQGLKVYFTGKPCPHGHIAVRGVSDGACRECKRLHCAQNNKDHYRAHRQEYIARAAKWRSENLDKARDTGRRCERKRRANPETKVIMNRQLREWQIRRNENETREERSYRLLVRNLYGRLYVVVTSQYNVKAAATLELLGCTPEHLRAYLEAQFEPGMSWENYGRDGWHVDHIRPCASFDLTDPAQQRECFHFANLQPLWAADNLAKRDTWEPSAA